MSPRRLRASGISPENECGPSFADNPPPTRTNTSANPLIPLLDPARPATDPRHGKNRLHTSPRPVAGKGARPCGLSRRERDEREGQAPATRVCRPTPTFSASTVPPQKRKGPQAASHRVVSVRPFPSGVPLGTPGTKSVWQGTCAVPGIGFARLRPARRRPCRQGAKSVAGPGWGNPPSQADSHRSDIACGAFSLSPKHTFPSVSGRQPGAPPAHPTLNRLRVSAGGVVACPVFESSEETIGIYVHRQTY